MKRTYNWEAVRQEVDRLLGTGANWTYATLSQNLRIPVSTLRDNITLPANNLKVQYEDDEVAIEENGEFPKTPETLARLAGIDLSQYNVKSFDCFAREVQVKDIEKDLIFDEGKITGSIRDSGNMKIKTIWSSRLLLAPVRIKPRFLTLAPVIVSNSPKQVKRGEILETGKRTLILPDIHFGFGKYGTFHDEKALDAVVDITEKLRPDRIILLGDLLDLAEFSDRFLPEPEAIRTTQESLNTAGKFLARLNEVSDAEKELLEGNHELRLGKQVRKHLMALAGVHAINETGEAISIPYLLGLRELGYKYIEGWPNNFIADNGVRFVHGIFYAPKPGQTAAKYFDKANWSTVFGHTHRREYLESVVWSDALNNYKPVFSYSPGCLCRIDGAVPGSSASKGWGQGIGLLTVLENGRNHIQDIPFDGEKFIL